MEEVSVKDNFQNIWLKCHIDSSITLNLPEYLTKDKAEYLQMKSLFRREREVRIVKSAVQCTEQSKRTN